MKDAAFPSKSEEKNKGSQPQAAADLLLGLAAREEEAPSPDGAVYKDIVGEAQTLSVAETVKIPEKEGTATPSKGRTSSTSSQRKTKAASSTVASSPAGTEAGTHEREEEEVNSDEHEDAGEEKVEMREAEQEEAKEKEGKDKDEPPTKRAKTPARRVKEESVDITTPEGMGLRGIVVPKVLDFGAFTELGVAEEVREKFNSIGWGKFLDLDMTSSRSWLRNFSPI